MKFSTGWIDTEKSKEEMKMCKCSKCKEEVEKTYNFDSDNMGLCWVCYKTMQLKEERDEFWTDED
jgi:formylmethanofuran dehydrogenase subunit E